LAVVTHRYPPLPWGTRSGRKLAASCLKDQDPAHVGAPGTLFFRSVPMRTPQHTRELISERCSAYQLRVKRALALLDCVEQGVLTTVPVVAGASRVAGR